MEDCVSGLSPRAALAEMDRVGQVVRHRSRWYGWFLLALGAGTVGYYAAVEVTPRQPAGFAALTVGWSGFVLLLAIWSRRQPVLWRGLRRLRLPVMTMYGLLVAATVLACGTVLEDQPGRWVLGVLPAIPCFAGAWLVLRR